MYNKYNLNTLFDTYLNTNAKYLLKYIEIPFLSIFVFTLSKSLEKIVD